MNIDLSAQSPGAVYALLTQAIIPRPVAWVLTQNADGSLNVAPFSYFTPLSSAPPLLGFSVGRRGDGSPKDTAANLAARPNFVVHIAHAELLRDLNASAADLPPGTSEVATLGLESVPFAGSTLPRLSRPRVALCCRVHRTVPLDPASQTFFIGEVDRLYVHDDIVAKDASGRLTLDPATLDPVARLGSTAYGLLGEVRHLPRP